MIGAEELEFRRVRGGDDARAALQKALKHGDGECSACVRLGAAADLVDEDERAIVGNY